MDWMHGFWGGGFMMVFWWAVLLIGIALLVKWIVSANKNHQATESALDILKKRYAKGEISKEEFEERKKDLI